jgi:hypothetical protein
MNSRRLVIAGVLAAGIIVFAALGTHTGTGAAPGPAARPQDDLLNASSHLGDSSLTIKLRFTAGDVGFSGAMDPATSQSDITFNVGPTGRLEMRLVGTDFYIEASSELAGANGAPADTWMYLDLTGLPDFTRQRLAGADPSQVGQMFSTTSDMSRSGHSYHGKIDFSQLPAFPVIGVGISQLSSQLADKAKEVPFTAITDDQGRLTKVVIDLGHVLDKAGQVTMEFGDFGAPVVVEAPLPTETVPMPLAFRNALGMR